MQLQFVGCGDALGSGGRFNTCFHVTGERVNFLIDCGASSLPALKRPGIVRDDIDLVLITHFHGDHFGGVAVPAARCPIHAADAGRSRSPGRKGIEMRLTQVMEAMFENSSKTKQRFDLRWSRSSRKRRRASARSRSRHIRWCTANPAGRSWPTGSRIEGRIIAYSADTEWTEALIRRAATPTCSSPRLTTYERSSKTI